MNIKRFIAHNKLILLTSLAGVTGFTMGQHNFFKQPLTSDYQAVKFTSKLQNSTIPAEDIYICPMHAEISSKDPGECPICGMDLVKHQHTISTVGFPAISISPTIKHNMGIKTAKATLGDLQHNIETLGKITRIDLTARKIITPPSAGIISYMVDKGNGDEVFAGELLFSITSDQLVEKQRQLQQLLSLGDLSAASLIIPQLINFGLSHAQITRLQSGEPANFAAEVYAKEEGYIFSKRGNIGDSIPAHFTVFNIGSNYQVVEVTAEIFERQWGWVKEGQQANMTVRGLPGLTFTGKVVDVEPPVGYTTRSLEVRLKFKSNHIGLSQSMFAHISIKGQTRYNILQVPRDTVIRTGDEDRIVLIRDDGLFQPVAVEIGEESEGMVEILSGINTHDTVVSSGQFLIDSESNLQAALNRMQSPQNHHFNHKSQNKDSL